MSYLNVSLYLCRQHYETHLIIADSVDKLRGIVYVLTFSFLKIVLEIIKSALTYVLERHLIAWLVMIFL